MIVIIPRLRIVPNLKLPIMQQLLGSLARNLYSYLKLSSLFCELNLLRKYLHMLLLDNLLQPLPLRRCQRTGARRGRPDARSVVLGGVRLNDHGHLLVVVGEGVAQLDCIEFCQALHRQNNLLLAENEKTSVEIIGDNLQLLIQLLSRYKIRIGRPTVR